VQPLGVFQRVAFGHGPRSARSCPVGVAPGRLLATLWPVIGHIVDPDPPIGLGCRGRRSGADAVGRLRVTGPARLAFAGRGLPGSLISAAFGGDR